MSSSFRQRVYAILRNTGIGLAVLLFALFVLVQFQQRLLRHRAEKLMADMQSIRLHQTTWADAQTLMHRWGRWGHYEGQCTATDCRYSILIEDIFLQIDAHRNSLTDRPVTYNLLRSAAHWAYYAYVLAGGKTARAGATFIVQDGVIWRKSSALMVALPPKVLDPDYWLVLEAVATSRQTLSRDDGLGDEDQLADHPDYKYGRPGGCTFCMEVMVSYTPYEKPETVQRISTFNLSCLTPYRVCHTVEELLPAAKDWHVYDNAFDEAKAAAAVSQPHACLPIWVQARDTRDIFAVDVLKPAGAPKKYDGGTVRIVEVLKSYRSFPLGTIAATDEGPPPYLLLNHRYIVILPQLFEKEELDFYREGNLPGRIHIWGCNVFPDTPLVRTEIQKGLARNDALRGKGLGRM